MHVTGKRSNFCMILTVLQYSAQRRIARWLKCSKIYIKACKRGVGRSLNVFRMQHNGQSLHTFAYGKKGYWFAVITFDVMFGVTN